MSKLSRAIKYQRRQKAEKRRLRMEKKLRNSIWLTDTEEPDNMKDEGIPATESEVKDFLNGNNLLRKELSGFVNMKEHGVSYEEGFVIQSLMQARIHEIQMQNPHARIVVHDNGRILF